MNINGDSPQAILEGAPPPSWWERAGQYLGLWGGWSEGAVEGPGGEIIPAATVDTMTALQANLGLADAQTGELTLLGKETRGAVRILKFVVVGGIVVAVLFGVGYAIRAVR